MFKAHDDNTRDIWWPGLPADAAAETAASAALSAASTGAKVTSDEAQELVRQSLAPVVEEWNAFEAAATGYELARLLARARQPLSETNPNVEPTEGDLRDGLFAMLTTAPGDAVAEAVHSWHRSATELHREARDRQQADSQDEDAGAARLRARSALVDVLDERLASAG